ncbi:MAG: SH3 domain-containing protein [bacterium]|nr:SH3 domain-containing protein [bacterium]
MKLDTDFEEWDPEEEKEEREKEGSGTVKPQIRVLVFLGITALAVILAVILWSVTHRDRGEENSAAEQTGEAVPGEAGENLEAFSGETGEPGSGTGSGESGEPGSGTGSGETGEPGSGTGSGESGEPGSGTGSGESGESGSGTGSGESGEPGSGTGSGESGEPGSGTGSGESGEPGNGPGSEENGGTEPGEASGPTQEEKSENGIMSFAECQDTVTPKELINLRSAPSTAQADNIVTQAVNGEILARTGINDDTGWSRLEYNGQTLYAVSRYLTEDLTYQPPVSAPDANRVSTKDGRTIVFTDCDDRVSPKIHVNLRLEPSTSEGNATVHCTLDYGEVVHRTGISEESGWSRVEYDGNVLYVVSSYVYVVEESAE